MCISVRQGLEVGGGEAWGEYAGDWGVGDARVLPCMIEALARDLCVISGLRGSDVGTVSDG